MGIFLYPLYTCVNLLFLFRELKLFQRVQTSISLLLAIELMGLVYDTLLICLGNQLGAGPLLESLSRPRFLFHVLMTPLTIVIALELVRQGGVLRQRLLRPIMWVVALGLIGYGIFTDFVDIDLVPVTVGGVLYYTHAIPPGPPLAAIVTIVIALVLGGVLWQKTQWPWLCVGAMVIFVGYGVLARRFGMVVGYGAEQLFIASLLATQYWVSRRQVRLT